MKPTRVLVVEDDPRVRDMLQRGLTEDGYAIDTARDGSEALERGLSFEYDAIVLDLKGSTVVRLIMSVGATRRHWVLTQVQPLRITLQARRSGADAEFDRTMWGVRPGK